MSTLILTGISGVQYQYEVCDVNGDWKAVPGNYALAGLVGSTLATLRWVPFYIGETENFSTRFPHEQWGQALMRGATHALARVNYGGVEARRAEERDLVRAYDPPLNTEYRTGLRGVTAGQSPLAQALLRANKRGGS